MANALMPINVFKNAIGFVKVSIPKDHTSLSNGQSTVLLDQTRIHVDDYQKMERIAVFIQTEGANFDSIDAHKRTEAVSKLFKDPDVLR